MQDENGEPMKYQGRNRVIEEMKNNIPLYEYIINSIKELEDK